MNTTAKVLVFSLSSVLFIFGLVLCWSVRQEEEKESKSVPGVQRTVAKVGKLPEEAMKAASPKVKSSQVQKEEPTQRKVVQEKQDVQKEQMRKELIEEKQKVAAQKKQLQQMQEVIDLQRDQLARMRENAIAKDREAEDRIDDFKERRDIERRGRTNKALQEGYDAFKQIEGLMREARTPKHMKDLMVEFEKMGTDILRRNGGLLGGMTEKQQAFVEEHRKWQKRLEGIWKDRQIELGLNPKKAK